MSYRPILQRANRRYGHSNFHLGTKTENLPSKTFKGKQNNEAKEEKKLSKPDEKKKDEKEKKNDDKEKKNDEKEKKNDKEGSDEKTDVKPTFSLDSIPSHCKKDTFEFKTQGDVSSINGCEIIVGDVKVTDYKEPFLILEDTKYILGNFIVTNSPELIRIEAPNAISISKNFELKRLTSLSLVSFPALKSTKKLDWQVLPILSSVEFGDDIKDLESITVSDTSLTGFSGFSSDTLEILDINNNRFLDSINSSVARITSKLHIAANADDVTVSLPLLRVANNMSIHDVQQIDFGGLEEIDNSVSFINNHFGLLKLPKLKSIGGTLSILKNDKVNEIELPTVSTIGGGLMIVNNNKIDKINFLPKLSTIGGAIELVGSIKETTMKQLKLVKGSAKIKSTDKTFDCTKWSRSEISAVIRGGKIECTNANNEKIVANTPTDGGSIDDIDDYESTNSDLQYDVKYRSHASSFISKIKIDYVVFIFLSLISLT
ncbi:uncharacterized protein PRCAT00006147001 [Priceomyces carsonii]|uniref:uncharacterized protein n=1 Tax=Priceomyces carsonii TaxID=28549 RepID=UPI002EDB45EF|nr:unnamed protein product [Priceomyces carsonii]